MQNQIRNVYWDEKLNVEQEKATGTAGVVIKGGQGEYQGYLAHECKYVEECERLAMPWGISWQMDARYSPVKHKAALKFFRDKIGFGPLGLWLACELPFYPCPTKLYQLMPFNYFKPIESVWRGMFEFTGEYPGIYISISKWNLIFGQCPLPLQKEFAENSKLWAAQYKTDKPDQIGQWLKWFWWQYQENPDYSVDQPHEPPAAGSEENNVPVPVEDPDRDAILDEAIQAIEAIKSLQDAPR